jgi:hypothetical protein
MFSLQNLNIIMLYYNGIYMLLTSNFLIGLCDRPVDRNRRVGHAKSRQSVHRWR